jgi:hypothetical protein
VAAFNAYVITNASGQVMHKVVFLVRRPSSATIPLPLKPLSEDILDTYGQQLTPFDIEVVEVDGLKKSIKKLNKRR